MEIKLFSLERTKRWIFVLVLLTALLAYGVWKTLHEDRLADLSDPDKILGDLLGIIVSLALPLSALIGIYRRKPGGVEAIGIWILITITGLEFSLTYFGTHFFFPREWWSIAAIFIFSVLLGGDLWRSSIWCQSPAEKILSKLGLKKVFSALLVLILLILVPSAFIYWGLKYGFASPPFILRTSENPVVGNNDSPILPFSFQVDFPQPPEIYWLHPKEGSLGLKVGKSLWTLESTNTYNEQIKDLFHPSKPVQTFLEEQYGVFPNLIKSGSFGQKPEYFFEIKQKDLWGAVSITEMKKNEPAFVRVFLWDDAGKPLGAITGFAPSLDPKDWNWVYSIRKTESPAWSSEKYSEDAKICLAKGQTSLAGIYLGSAVLADKDKTPGLKVLIGYFQKRGLTEKAKVQLEIASRDYPQDPILKSIHLPGDIGK